MTSAEASAALVRARGRDVRVAVVDSGWPADVTHPQILPMADAPGSESGDRVGHGTLCALRVLQVAPGAQVVPVRVFHNRLETSVPELCQGIEAAVEFGARIVNLSLATRREDALRPLYQRCEDARRRGVIVVAAAHNMGGRAFPAYLEPALSVGAGPQTHLLDFTFEPDEVIECTTASSGVPIAGVDGRPICRHGSSIAAATLSGIVARVLEIGAGDLDEVRIWLARVARPGSRRPPTEHNSVGSER